MPDSWRLVTGDCLDELPMLPAQSVQCCVTSPPYWGLRDYAHEDQLGQERTPSAYVERLVEVFRHVRRVLRDDGTLWLNLGDTYASTTKGRCGGADKQKRVTPDVPNKNLVGIPWRVVFALQADGWVLRSDVIWAKPNPMPESVTDRPTWAHEYVFLLTKQPRYSYDAAAIREPLAESTCQQFKQPYTGQATKDYAAAGAQDPSELKARIVDKQRGHGRRHAGFNDRWDAMSKTEQQATGANKRSVWTIATQPFPDAHFATYPPKLVEPCILAGSRRGDTVLDPFAGSGTTGAVACGLGRQFIGIELNPEYVQLARARIAEADERYQGGPLFRDHEPITEQVAVDG